MDTTGKTTKQISQYLHLYLGCQIRLHSNITNTFGTWRKMTFRDIELVVVHGEKCQIELRKIENMTEDEALDIYKLYDTDWESYLRRHNEQCPGETFSALDYIKGGRYVNSIYSISSQPSQAFAYLLSKHFDLFGLIDAGLAIDKSKL